MPHTCLVSRQYSNTVLLQHSIDFKVLSCSTPTPMLWLADRVYPQMPRRFRPCGERKLDPHCFSSITQNAAVSSTPHNFQNSHSTNCSLCLDLCSDGCTPGSHIPVPFRQRLTHNRPQLSPLHGECAEVEGDQDLAEHLSPGPKATSSMTTGYKAL